MLSVLPSGGDLIIAAVPTMPPAPGWFSITTEAPSAVESACDDARVIVSTPDAVATGRMKRTTFVWLWAAVDQIADAPMPTLSPKPTAPSAISARRFFDLS